MFEMKKFSYQRVINILLLMILFQLSAKAQSPLPDSLLAKAFTTDKLLPMLIDSAVKFSPEVNRVNYTLDYIKDEQKINKNSIYNALSFLSSYNYGTNFSAITKAPGVIGNDNFTKAQTGYYNVGIGLQLPLSLLLNHKNIAHADQSLVKASESEKEKSALFVKQEVIRLYQNLKLSYKLVVLSSKNKQAAQINYDMSEKNFIQGQTDIAVITSVGDVFNKASIEFETEVNNFQTYYFQLEAYCNVDLSLLIKQVK